MMTAEREWMTGVTATWEKTTERKPIFRKIKCPQVIMPQEFTEISLKDSREQCSKDRVRMIVRN